MYLILSHLIIDLIKLKSLIKEVIGDLLTHSVDREYLSRSTVYEDNNSDIVVATSSRTTHNLKNISVKFHCSRHHFGNFC